MPAMLPVAFSSPSDHSLLSGYSLLGDANESFWFPEQASTFADNVDSTYSMILWISAAFFVGIVFCLIYFTIRYWKKRGGKAESQVTHNTPLELAWSILPSFLLAWMFVQGAISYLDMRTPPDGAYEIGVQAFRWGWTMDYGGGTMNPELHILVDEPTKLSMRSTDVIHSLYVPAFRAKKDIVPGRYNYMWFEATTPSEKVSDEKLQQAIKATGSDRWNYDRWQFTPDGYRFFDLFCAEYCGLDHSDMQSVVVVHKTREDLDAWIKKYSQRGDTPPEEWGRRIYQQRGCQGCHSIDGTKRVGPSFQDLYGSQHALVRDSEVTVTPNYIRESIINPQAKVHAGYQPVMPSYKGQLSDDDIDSVVAFLKSLSDAAPTATTEPAEEPAALQSAEPEAATEPEAAIEPEAADAQTPEQTQAEANAARPESPAVAAPVDTQNTPENQSPVGGEPGEDVPAESQPADSPPAEGEPADSPPAEGEPTADTEGEPAEAGGDEEPSAVTEVPVDPADEPEEFSESADNEDEQDDNEDGT